MPKKFRAAIVAAVCVALLAGCAPEPDVARGYESFEGDELVLSWSAEFVPAGYHVLAGEAALGYELMPNQTIELVARGLDSGEELWRKPAVIGATSSSRALMPATIELDGKQVVGYLAPVEGATVEMMSQLAVVDAMTGDPVDGIEALPVAVSSRPRECDETLCFEASLTMDPSNREVYELDVASGDLVLQASDGDEGYFEGGYSVGDYLSVAPGAEYGDDFPDLQYGKNGAIIWSRPFSDIFDRKAHPWFGAGFSDEDPDEPVLAYVRSGTRMQGGVASTIFMPLNKAILAGLDPATGETLWSMNNVDVCDPNDHRIEARDGVLVMCEVPPGSSRQGDYDGQDLNNVTSKITSVDLIGIDIFTGAVLWKVPLGAAPRTADDREDGSPALMAMAIPFVSVDGEAMIIDRQTGAITNLPSDTAFLCETRGEYVEIAAQPPATEPSWQKLVDSTSLCSADATLLDGGTITLNTMRPYGTKRLEPHLLTTAGGLEYYARE